MDKEELPPRLRDLLGPAARRVGLDAGTHTGLVWTRWRDIVGEEIAVHAEPTSLRSGVLRIRTDSPSWATELAYLGGEIRRRVNQTVGRDLVAEVRVWTGPGPIRYSAPPQPRATPSAPSSSAGEDPMTALGRARAAWSERKRRRS